MKTIAEAILELDGTGSGSGGGSDSGGNSDNGVMVVVFTCDQEEETITSDTSFQTIADALAEGRHLVAHVTGLDYGYIVMPLDKYYILGDVNDYVYFARMSLEDSPLGGKCVMRREIMYSPVEIELFDYTNENDNQSSPS